MRLRFWHFTFWGSLVLAFLLALIAAPLAYSFFVFLPLLGWFWLHGQMACRACGKILAFTRLNGGMDVCTKCHHPTDKALREGTAQRFHGSFSYPPCRITNIGLRLDTQITNQESRVTNVAPPTTQAYIGKFPSPAGNWALGFGIAGFVLSLIPLGVLVTIPAIVLGIRALRKKGVRKTQAIVALSLSAAGWFVSIALFMSFFPG